jgi:hypothetical protein
MAVDENGNPIEDPNLDPEADPEPELIPEPEPEPAPDPQAELIDKIAARVTQNLQSFDGRKFAQLKDELVDHVRSIFPQAQTPATTPPTVSDDLEIDTTEFLNNPGEVLNRAVSKILEKKQKNDNKRSQDFVKAADSIMTSDPMFQGEEGQKLGMEVVEEVAKIPINPMLDPAVQAELSISKAKANVLSRRMSTGKPVTALDKNKPVDKPIGGVGGGNPPAKSPSKVKVADDVRERAKRMGMTDEEIDAGLAE